MAATPSSGMIPLWASVILGITAGIVCNLSTKIKYLLHVDDSLDVWAEHGMAGVVGLIFNALFGSATVIGYDGVTDHQGGWIDHNWKQLYIQIVYILATMAYSGVVTAILCFVINKIPGLHLRIDYNGEEAGVDEDQIGEFAYDYVEVRRDFLDWGIPTVNPTYQNLINDQQQQQQQPEVPEITSQQKRVGGGLSGIEETEEKQVPGIPIKRQTQIIDGTTTQSNSDTTSNTSIQEKHDPVEYRPS